MRRRGLAFFLVPVSVLAAGGGSAEGYDRVEPQHVKATIPIEPWAANLDPCGRADFAIAISGGLTPSTPCNPTSLRYIQLSGNGISYGVPHLPVHQALRQTPVRCLDSFREHPQEVTQK